MSAAATKTKRPSRAKPIASTTETAQVADLRPHPRSYRTYPADRIAHLVQAIRDYGFTRNVTVARDGTVLTGLDLVEAARALGLKEVPAVRLDIKPDDPRALKVMVSEQGSHLDEVDDRALTELLKEVKDKAPGGLTGTGYDERMLANLLFVTRPMSEVKDFDAAAHWVGLPKYEDVPKAPPNQLVRFRCEADRAEFFRTLGLDPATKMKSMLWPPKAKDDLASLRFVG